MRRWLSFFLVGLIVFLQVGFVSAQVSTDKLKTLQTPFYDADSTDTGCYIDPVSMNGSTNVEKAFSFFLAKGFSAEQAAGILGNFIQESGVIPARVQGSGMKLSKTVILDGKTGYGIAQWTSLNRQQKLVEFASNQNLPVYSLALQLNFVMEEMSTNFPGLEDDLKKISGDGSIADATFLFHRVYEASADSPSQILERVDSAKKTFAQFSGLPASQDVGQGNDLVCDSTSSSSGDVLANYGSKDQLISAILDSPNVKFGNYGSASSQQQDVRGCLTETTLLGFASMAEKSGVKILVNALATDHGGCNGGSSLHNQGRAIDVGYFGNGSPNHVSDGDTLFKYLYDNADKLNVAQLIWTDPPAGYRCIGGSKPVDCQAYYGAATVAEHVHHIHVGFQS